MDDNQPVATLRHLPFTTDNGALARARLGLLVLQSDQTIEAEFRALTNLADVETYHARLANETAVSSDTLQMMEAELPRAAALLPGYLNLSAIGYGCTSGATIIGEERVANILAAAHPGVPSTTPIGAAKAAFKSLGIRRIGLLTPYAPEVTKAMQQNFVDAGFEIPVVGSFYEDNDIVVGRIDAASILAATLEIGRSPMVEGVFVSCTSLRAAEVIPKAEHLLGKPVTASNHALAWHLLRLAGIADQSTERGRLFSVLPG